MNIDVSPDWWKTLFDEVYLITDARSVCDADLTRREVDLFCKMIPIKSRHRILDLCGGHGRHSLELCARGFTCCTLLDYSYCLVKSAYTNARNESYPIQCVRADARNTGLAPERYDHVLILGNSLGYALEPHADKEILSEAWRLLRPDGWTLVDITNGDRVRKKITPMAWHEIPPDYVVCRNRRLEKDIIRAREIVMSKQKGLIRDTTYAIRLYGPGAVQTLLEDAGFINVRIYSDFSPHSRRGDFGFMDCRMIATGQKPGRDIVTDNAQF